MDILVIDDEASIRRATALALEASGHYVEAVENSALALAALKEERFDMALLDLHLGKENGLEVLPTLHQAQPGLPVVMFTAQASIAAAVEATRRGAVDFLEKPFSPDQLRRALQRIKQLSTLQEEVRELKTQVQKQSPEPRFESKDEASRAAMDMLFRAADTTASILILGESGTGKSITARAVHEQSPFRDKPFVTVSCPSLSRELLESELFGHVKGSFTGAVRDVWGKVKAAEGGTLFLDEIGELPLELQPKLLRLLQEREYERVGETVPRKAQVRVIAATNRDLKSFIAEGRFREDLFYRLNVISVTMPPLRARPNDLVEHAEQFRDFFASQFGRKVKRFAPDAITVLRANPWPGNVRELRNAIERAVILAAGSEIRACDLPDPAGGGHSSSGNGVDGPRVGSHISLEELEKEHIKRVLGTTASLQEAASILGIDAATLYRKRKRYELGG